MANLSTATSSVLTSPTMFSLSERCCRIVLIYSQAKREGKGNAVLYCTPWREGWHGTLLDINLVHSACGLPMSAIPIQGLNGAFLQAHRHTHCNTDCSCNMPRGILAINNINIKCASSVAFIKGRGERVWRERRKRDARSAPVRAAKCRQ